MKSMKISASKDNRSSFLMFLSYAIPILILLTILYSNYLPFGFSDEKTIEVGSKNDTRGVFFLEENKNLSARQTTDRGTFRLVDGIVNAVYKPRVVLKNAKIKVQLEGENVYFPALPSLDFLWDYDWKAGSFENFEVFKDSTEEEGIELKNDCIYFDGNTRLVLPESENLFEKGPFAIYVEWIPEKQEDFQQIIGHQNWEIYQNGDSVSFQIGRTTETESYYSIKFPIDANFFGKKHSLLALYNPSTNANGYITIFVNSEFAARMNIGNEKIKTQDAGLNLSLGWSRHSYGELPYFKGSICNPKFSYKELHPQREESVTFTTAKHLDEIKIPFWGDGKLKKMHIKVEK